jgi:hypothetical protein
MERAIIHSDLKKEEINPIAMIEKYLSLLKEDIKVLLSGVSLQDVPCPVTGEQEVAGTIMKMGMEYKISQTQANIYLSPRPSQDALKVFYNTSQARKFWITNIWPQTKDVRQNKIILPMLDWALVFILQYLKNRNLHIAEFLPNHWGYYLAAKNIWHQAQYNIIAPLYDTEVATNVVNHNDLEYNTPNNTLDVALLFEALDRAVDPIMVLKKVHTLLKPGGLCFITALLSSGFEVQVLKDDSEIFIPPERMNILSYDGMIDLIDTVGGFEILEFSTPGLLDIDNVREKLDVSSNSFINYIIKKRQNSELSSSFQNFLQKNCLGSFGRLVLMKLC